MTVSSTVTRVTYAGDGATTAFATTFPFFAAAEIEVVERVIATGAETLKTLTTHYTVSGGQGATGTVTAAVAPPAGVQWVLRRNTARTQEIDYTANDPFPAETHEEGLDRLKMNVQELGEEFDRALKFPKTDPATLSAALPNSVARAGKYLAFDATGNVTAAPGTADATVHNAFMTTLHGAADAAAARSTLGLGTAASRNIGTAADQIPTNADITSVPAGSVTAYAGTSEPAGWLFCHGQAVSRTTYGALFTALGTAYGAGDGATTFNLPDLRGRVIAGKDDMGGLSANRLTGLAGGLNGDVLGASGGAETHTLTTAEMPAHTHAVTLTNRLGNDTSGARGPAWGSDAITAGTATATMDSAGSGTAHNNVQPTIILNYIIKT